MKSLKPTITFLIILILSGVTVLAIDKSSYIESTRSYYKEAYQDSKPVKMVISWMFPFNTKDRYDIRTIRVEGSRNEE